VGVSGFSINGLTVSAYTVVSGTTITFAVPAGATSGTISVSTPAGAGTSTSTFTVQAPKVSSFTPTAAAVGATVTVTGTYFAGATTVSLNGVALTGFTIVSASSITFVVPANAATGAISVTTPSGTNTSPNQFKVLPTISGFAPANGAPGTVITMTGTGLTGVTSVTLNGLTVPVFATTGSTLLTVEVPALGITGKLAVTTPGGTATTTTAFSVAPLITGLLPAQGAPGSIVLVQGLNFVSGTTVKFNGVSATTTFNSATLLTATVPTGATTGPLSATNANGTGTSATDFTVVSGTLAKITSFTPTTNVIAGTSITITGTGFTGATGVRFNNVDAETFSVISATCITALVPAGATTGKVYVTTPSGTAQSGSSLIIIQAPAITSFTPASGPVGTLVTINGANFTGATGVSFGGVNATIYTVSSAAKITVTVPAGALTGALTVTTIAGTAVSTTAFTVISTRSTAATMATATDALMLEVYPNPATSDATVWAQISGLSGTVTGNVEVFDITGLRVRAVDCPASGMVPLPVSGLPAGTYLVRYNTVSQRLVVSQ
jgi:hypothetical protein